VFICFALILLTYSTSSQANCGALNQLSGSASLNLSEASARLISRFSYMRPNSWPKYADVPQTQFHQMPEKYFPKQPSVKESRTPKNQSVVELTVDVRFQHQILDHFGMQNWKPFEQFNFFYGDFIHPMKPFKIAESLWGVLYRTGNEMLTDGDMNAHPMLEGDRHFALFSSEKEASAARDLLRSLPIN
jgi:hypothetical protein